MKYNHKTLLDPKLFDKRSFRTIRLNKNGSIKGIIACRSGFYDPKNNTCMIGTELQTILTSKTLNNPIDPDINYKSKIKNINIDGAEFIGNIIEIKYAYMNKLYKHKFKRSPALYGGNQFIIAIDNKLKTTKRGIEDK